MFTGSLIDDLISSVELAERHVHESELWKAVPSYQLPVLPRREYQQYYQRPEVA
jgi:hypothetical protein